MVNEERALLLRLGRELAVLRGEVAVLRSALALSPDETMASMAGRVRRQLDDATTAGAQAMENVHILFGNTVISQDGRAWAPLSMPYGARGTAVFRPASDGSLALQFALSWRSAPGSATLAGVPRELWPARPWSDGAVSVAGNGLVTLNVTGTAFAASVLVPLK